MFSTQTTHIPKFMKRERNLIKNFDFRQRDFIKFSHKFIIIVTNGSFHLTSTTIRHKFSVRKRGPTTQRPSCITSKQVSYKISEIV